MGSSGGPGGGSGSNPVSESIVISKTTNGPFSVAMSTSFQPAEWDYLFFTLNPTATTEARGTGAAPHSVCREFPRECRRRRHRPGISISSTRSRSRC